MSAIRICHEPKCHTRLSRYNPGPKCWFHTPMANERNHGNGKRGRTPRVEVIAPVEERHMSDRFIAGVPDNLTNEDRELIRSGEWVGVTK